MPNQKKTPINNLPPKSAAILDMLTNRGLVGDNKIDDEVIRQAEKEKNRRMYHNTQLLLKHYRNIKWILECFPANLAKELGKPMHDLDALISAVSEEIELDNRKLENRLKSVAKSRMLLEKFHEAMDILKQKPETGQKMYDIIFNTYMIPEKLTHNQLIYRLVLSTRHYYRLRDEAFNILSLRLWAAPTNELDSWLDVLSILENI